VCDRDRPLRAVVGRLTVRELESARDTAQARSRAADDPQTANMFNRVADEMTAELDGRYWWSWHVQWWARPKTLNVRLGSLSTR